MKYEWDLSSLNEVKTWRLILCQNASKYELDGFCGISMKAYGAVVYLQSINDKDEVKTTPLSTKWKVAQKNNYTSVRIVCRCKIQELLTYLPDL